MKHFYFNQNLLSTLIGIFLGIFLLNYFFSDNKKQIRLDELALGKDNKTVFANFEGKRIHCGDTSDLNLCLKGYKNSNVELPVTLWLGNSQLHAINQYHEGDQTAALLLHKDLKKFDIYTLTFSQANANLQEHYLLLAYLLEHFPIQTLVLPVVFDDLREDDIRQTIEDVLTNQFVINRIKDTNTGKNLISKFNNKVLTQSVTDWKEESSQDYFENSLDKSLNKFWLIWSKREDLRGSLFAKLYIFRNYIFGITPSTTRKMIPGRYAKNISAFKDILKLSLKNKLEVLVYIPPIRNDIKIPYNFDDYKNFKIEIENITKKNNFRFISLENIVPTEFWGEKGSTNLKKEKEVDFMHFQSNGHRLLAQSLFLVLTKLENK